MNSWIELMWDRPPETDLHRDQERNPYQKREMESLEAIVGARSLRITDFVGPDAIGDNRKTAGELLRHSRLLIAQSKDLIFVSRMMLLSAKPRCVN